jgi:TolB-like protein/Flp pilus assembly protein TadD
MEPGETYEFGPFRLEIATGRLLRGSEVIPLAPKTFDVLVLLVRNAGRLVDKREIMQALWPDTVVEEANLTQQIFLLRKILGEQPGRGPYVETVPRRGYRFVAPVRRPGEPPPAPRARRWAALTASAVAVIAALVAARTLGHSPEAGRRVTIAVLPFENVSGKPAEDYFSDGFMAELIVALGRVDPAHIAVIARTSAMTYQGTKKNVQQIGRELGADYVVEGTAGREGALARITAELIEVRRQTQLWAESYKRPFGDTVAVQEEIVDAVAGHVGAPARRQRRVAAARRPVSPRAYELYLQGRYFWNKRTPDGVSKAREYFERAIAEDPSYASPYVGLVDAYVVLASYDLMPKWEQLRKAHEALDKAAALEDLGEVHTSRAFLYAIDCRWADAEAEFKRAIELSPNYPTAHHWYAIVLKDFGRFDEALREIRRARELDPLSLVINADIALILYWAHRFDDMIDACQKTLELDPTFNLAHYYLGYAYDQKGMYDEAIREYRQLPQASHVLMMLGRAYALSGRRKEALEVLEQLKKMSASPERFAVLYAALGDAEQAAHWTELRWPGRPACGVQLVFDPRYDGVREAPQFRELIRRAAEAGASPVRPSFPSRRPAS